MPTIFDLRHRSVSPSLGYFFDKGSKRLHVGVLKSASWGRRPCPENTLAAIQKGIALGVDFVEIDVRHGGQLRGPP
jgi:hypothetical protein